MNRPPGDTAISSGNVASYLLGTPEADPPAVLHGQETLSHSQLANRSDQFADSLSAAGIQTGDIVAIIGDNSIAWIVSYLAILKRGAVALPLSGRESDRLLRRALQFTGVRAVIGAREYADRASSVLGSATQAMLWLDEPAGQTNATPRRFEPVAVPPQHPAAIMMTSGSTAEPKGVTVSHRNIEVNTRAILSYLHLRADDRMMVVLPFCYCFGLSLLHTHLRVGASVVLNNRFMFPQKVVAEMQSRRCTGFAGVPSTYMSLLNRSRLAEASLPSLRHVQQAGGRLPVSLTRQLRAALGAHVNVFVMYGATEATARLSYLPPACLSEKEGSIGLPVPGMRFELRDRQGALVAPGQVGELIAIGDGITRGYHDDPALSAARFDARAFRTGDLARVDGDGFYYIEGRSADFIKSFGIRVSPREIEDVVIEHPNVAEAAVFGVPDNEAGEAITLCVVPRGELVELAHMLHQHCVCRLPNHKVPQHIHIVTALPRNAAGKLQRTMLAQYTSVEPDEPLVHS